MQINGVTIYYEDCLAGSRICTGSTKNAKRMVKLYGCHFENKISRFQDGNGLRSSDANHNTQLEN